MTRASLRPICLVLAALFVAGCRPSTNPPPVPPSVSGAGIKKSASPSPLEALPEPSPLVGKVAGSFAFADLDGGQVTSQSLAGKIVVLAWFDGNPPSHFCLAQLDRIYQHYRSNPAVAILAAAVQPETFSNNQLRELLQHWELTLPIIRDLSAVGRDQFRVTGAPSVVVLDGRRKIHWVEVGANPQLNEQLPPVLDRLLAGEDVADATWALYRAQRPAMAAVDVAGPKVGEPDPFASPPPPAVELPETKIVPSQDPRALKTTLVWTCKELTAPGNILAIDEGKPEARLIVLDGWRTAAVLDAQGKVVSRHKLPLPEGAAVTYLRTAVDKNGKRYFLGTASLGPQLYLFNDAWELLLAYPGSNQPHDGIGDAQLVDLQEEGDPKIYVGFWGDVGLQQLDLGGQRQWSTRRTTDVFSLGVSRPNELGWRRLLVATGQGTIVPVNQFGNADPAINVPSRAIHQIQGSDFAQNRPTVYLGLSYAADGQLFAVGLNDRLAEVWSYPLPPGTQRTHVQPIAAGHLWDSPAGVWVLAGPDGSVHFITDDGEFSDLMQTGSELHGLAVAQLAGQGLLLYSNAQGVTALRLERPAGAPPAAP